MVKKILIVIFTMILISACTGCSPEINSPEKHVESLRIADTMADMETLMCWTSHVVMAKAISIEEIKGASNNIMEYQFEVTENYCGQTEKVIRLHAEKGQYKKGRKYYLFLSKSDSVFWEYPLYENSTGDVVFRAKRTLVFPFTSGTVRYKWKEIEQIVKLAETEGMIMVETDDYITAYDTLEEAVRAADLVVKIEILSKQYHTSEWASYFVKPLEFVKGEEVNIGNSRHLQYGPESGEEYYLLLKDIGQGPEGKYVVFDKNYIAVEATPENRAVIENALRTE